MKKPKLHYCQKCETVRVCRGVRFCISCCREITHARETQMVRTKAAVGFLNSTNSGGKKIKMAAFLSIFHPEMGETKVRTLINGLE